MEITRQYYEREGCYYYYLKQDNKILEIIFGGNLDLYWSLRIIKDYKLTIEKNINAMYDEVKETFIITKENYFIYSLFEELYEDIKESRIFIPTKLKPDVDYFDTDEIELDLLNYMSEDEANKKNERHKKLAAYQLLFDGETIEWHSDEDEYSVADRVTINKVDDTFVLEFIRPYLTEEKRFTSIHARTPDSIHVRFRNSGSTYNPYNAIFMRMFNKLQNYNPEYHQLHMEEMAYQRKLALRKQSH